MAKTFSDLKDLDLNEQYKYHQAEYKKYQIRFIICAVLLLFTAGISLIPAIYFAYHANIHYGKAQALQAGIIGEIKSVQILDSLTDEYTVLHNVKVDHEGKSSQLDNVVIGPNGIFIVETKNIKGDVTGTDEDKNITIHKIGQEGGRYTSSMYNPAKQVSTHVYRTSNYLKSKGINMWIQGLVFFANPNYRVEVTSSKCKIFSDSDNGGARMVDFIENYVPNRGMYKPELVEAAIAALRE